MKRRPTSRDVADLAGVSRSAVSLVLNGRGQGNVSTEGQAAIRAAAKLLNYSPNSLALSLRTRRSATIGVVVESIDSTAAAPFLSGASGTGAESGYVLAVIESAAAGSADDVPFETLRARQVDGFVYLASSLKAVEPVELLTSSVAVLANCLDTGGVATSFLPDELDAGRAVGELLIGLGHSHIVIFADSSGPEAYGQRQEGVRKAVTDARQPMPHLVVAGGQIDEGYAAAMHVLSTFVPRPTAVFATNDRAAIGVTLAAAAFGLSVPRDLSVIGYGDDVSALATCSVPSLTTVRIPYRQMGEQVVRYVVDRVAGDGAAPRPSGPVLLPCPLMVRDSVAPATGR